MIFTRQFNTVGLGALWGEHPIAPAWFLCVKKIIMTIYSQEVLSKAYAGFLGGGTGRSWTLLGGERTHDEFIVSRALQFNCYLPQTRIWETFSIKA